MDPEGAAVTPKLEPILTSKSMRALVLEENERLSRFIRNLYLKFRLERYPETELFEHICRELAQYLHTDVSTLFLVRYKRRPAKLRRFLELVGAFGPWQEALRPNKVRVKKVTRYNLNDPGGVTPRAYRREIPTVCSSREELELLREIGRTFRSAAGGGSPKEEPTQHLIWRYTNLYYTCRNVIMCSIRRQPDYGLPPIGLLKIENRTPRGLRGFGLTATTNELFFAKLWDLAALQPYLTDLARSEDVFSPVHNNEGWRLRYQESPVGVAYFESLRAWLKRQKDQGADKKLIKKKYVELRDNLTRLLRFLPEAETLLQNIAYAQAVLGRERHMILCGSESPPAPSFFNSHNLSLAIAKAGGGSIEGTWRILESHAIACGLRRTIEKAGIFLPEAYEKEHNGKAPVIVREVLGHVLGNEQVGGDITLFVEDGLRVPWDFRAAGQPLLDFILTCAREVRDAVRASREHGTQGCDDEAHARLQIEERNAGKLADQILRMGDVIPQCFEQVCGEAQDWLQKEAERLKQELLQESSASPRPTVDDLTSDASVTTLLLARWSALAAMGAHTFDETDAYRIMFIASHVAQVLDGNLMQQARQRSLPLTYDDFALLGLNRDSLEWLQDLIVRATRIATLVAYRIQKEIRKEQLPDTPPTCQEFDLNRNVLQPIRDQKGKIRDARNGVCSSDSVNIVLLKVAPAPRKSETLQILKDWVDECAREESAGSARATCEPAADTFVFNLTIPISVLAATEPRWLVFVQDALDQVERRLAA